MIWLSEMLMQNQDLESFQQLIELIHERAQAGERFLSSDVRPPFPDTPMDWEERIEAAFTSPSR